MTGPPGTGVAGSEVLTTDRSALAELAPSTPSTLVVGSGSGVADAACATERDAAKARVCPVSGGEVVPRMFVLQ